MALSSQSPVDDILQEDDPSSLVRRCSTTHDAARALEAVPARNAIPSGDAALDQAQIGFWHPTGFDYARGSSEVTAGRYPDDHHFTYEGRRELFEEHLRLGSGRDPQRCLRIHFKKDPTKRRVVVAHVGKHLRIRST